MEAMTKMTTMTKTAGALPARTSRKGFVPTLLLCMLLGGIGVHRFYVGKIGTGILQLLTLGGFGIWALVDLISIATGNFTDAEGQAIKA
jgi:TM2 domain-containing membrane protein YozV